jgi:hypothetical protein
MRLAVNKVMADSTLPRVCELAIEVLSSAGADRLQFEHLGALEEILSLYVFVSRKAATGILYRGNPNTLDMVGERAIFH